MIELCPQVAGSQYANRVDTTADSLSDVPGLTADQRLSSLYKQAQFELAHVAKNTQFLLSKPDNIVQIGYTL